MPILEMVISVFRLLNASNLKYDGRTIFSCNLLLPSVTSISSFALIAVDELFVLVMSRTWEQLNG